MKMWQYFGLFAAIWLSPYRANRTNLSIGVLSVVVSIIAAVLDK